MPEPAGAGGGEAVQALVEAVLELASDGEREAFLERECDDPDTRARVEALLASEDAAAGFFDSLAGSLRLNQPPAEPGVDLSGRQIGAYRLIEPLGRGGMGVVYLAERADGEFEQRVALKLLAMGVSTPDARQRFLAERQILAGLEHPSIARLFDGGVAEDGTPYFVLEHVEGERIDRWCDRQELSIDERLRLMIQVCEAVEAAHRQLIVHRDLKPSNVLVTEDGRPKLLDFGVAKVLSDSQSGHTLSGVTGSQGAPLTPAWAAPEQLSGAAVTTATDTHALGALLYLLLTGVPPHDLKDTSPTALAARLETEPVTPSRRLASLGVDEQTEIAKNRDTTPGNLTRALQGDLDAVVSRALAPDSARRYGSAGDLADDLRAHLDSRPVSARPPSRTYRAARFVARHRLGVAASVVVGASLLGGLGAALWQARVASAERDLARIESTKAAQVTEFLVDLFEVSDPDRAQGRQITARELLDSGSERIRQQLADQPQTRAAMLVALGRVYRRLGDSGRAAGQLLEALRVYSDPRLASPEDVATALLELGRVRMVQARHDEAEMLLRSSLPMAEALYGNEDLKVTPHLMSLGEILTAQWKYEESEEVLTRALAIRRRELGNLHPDVAATRIALGVVLHYSGRFDEVEQLFGMAAQTYRRQPEAVTTDYARALNLLANIAIARRQHDKAEAYVVEGLRVYERLYGLDHHDMADMLSTASRLRERQGDLEIAVDLAERALASLRNAPQPRVAAQGDALRLLARVRINQGLLDQAEQAARRAVRLERERGDPVRLAVSLWQLGNALREQGSFSRARHAYDEILGDLAAKLPPGHSQLPLTEYDYGVLAGRQGDWRDAEVRLRRALAGYQPLASADSYWLAMMRLELGRTLLELGNDPEARAALDLALPVLESTFDDDDRRVRDAQALLKRAG